MMSMLIARVRLCFSAASTSQLLESATAGYRRPKENVLLLDLLGGRSSSRQKWQQQAQQHQ